MCFEEEALLMHLVGFLFAHLIEQTQACEHIQHMTGQEGSLGSF